MYFSTFLEGSKSFTVTVPFTHIYTLKHWYKPMTTRGYLGFSVTVHKDTSRHGQARWWIERVAMSDCVFYFFWVGVVTFFSPVLVCFYALLTRLGVTGIVIIPRWITWPTCSAVKLYVLFLQVTNKDGS